MNREQSEELKEAIKIVSPVAVLCGVSNEDTREILSFILACRNAGLSGSEAAFALINQLKLKMAEMSYKNLQDLGKEKEIRDDSKRN